MDLGHLLTFRTVVDCGSFSRAAERLGLSQPAVSQQIRVLETRLGQRLLDRARTGVTATPAGEIAYRAACDMLETERELMDDLAQAEQRVAGRLTIGSSTGPGELILPRLCAQFTARYPEVQLTLEVSDSSTICDAVRDGDVELGVVGAESDRRGVVFEPVITDELVLIAPTDHDHAARASISVAELAEQPMIVQQRGSGVRAVVDAALAAAGRRLEPDMIQAEMGLQQSAKAAVLEGLGMTVISRAAVEREVSQGDLAQIEIVDPPLRRSFFAAQREGRTPTPACREFLALCRAEGGATAEVV